jgi:hypothetical protein
MHRLYEQQIKVTRLAEVWKRSGGMHTVDGIESLLALLPSGHTAGLDMAGWLLHAAGCCKLGYSGTISCASLPVLAQGTDTLM